MIRGIVLISVACVVCVLAHSLDNVDTSLPTFFKFTQKYGKIYSSEDEQSNRYQIWKQNVLKAAKLSKSSERTHFGVTKFSDLTEEEFQSQHFMTNSLSRKNFVPKFKNSNALPPQFDWNQKGKVTPVKNEGECGSSIAYSVIESVESCWAIAGNDLIELSVDQLALCVEGGCDGGFYYYDDWNYVLHNGLTSQVSFQNNCKQAPDASISSWSNITEDSSESKIQSWVYANAPVSVCLDGANWQFYDGGIMTAEQCGNQIDTCAQITGWLTTNGTLVWNVRNDWGEDWGINGYIWVEMGSNACGIADYATGCIGK